VKKISIRIFLPISIIWIKIFVKTGQSGDLRWQTNRNGGWFSAKGNRGGWATVAGIRENCSYARS